MGGEVEEHWNQPNEDSMLGMFRLTTKKQTKVCEFLMISKEKERVVYRFKHFNLDFSTWEEDGPLEFTLIELSDTEAVFESELDDQRSPRRLTYRLSEDKDDRRTAVVVESATAIVRAILRICISTNDREAVED